MQTFKNDFYKICCCSSGKRNSNISSVGSVNSADSDMLSDTLSSFLTSSLNVELVYTILKGIRRIVKTTDLET